MHLIDERRAKVLSDRGNSAAESDIFVVGGFGRARQHSVNVIGDKVEDGAAIHGDRWPRMVGEYENGSVVRRVVAPPPPPRVVGPRSTNRPQHVSTHNPRA